MERALTTVQRAMPDVIQDRDAVRKTLIEKYENDTIDNLVGLRSIAKIARAEYVAADREQAEQVLIKLFERNTYTIEQAYEASVSVAYSERDILTRVNALNERLDRLRPNEIDEELRENLEKLAQKIGYLLEE